jgi:CHASE3 domain sensor protein
MFKSRAITFRNKVSLNHFMTISENLIFFLISFVVFTEFINMCESTLRRRKVFQAILKRLQVTASMTEMISEYLSYVEGM